MLRFVFLVTLSLFIWLPALAFANEIPESAKDTTIDTLTVGCPQKGTLEDYVGKACTTNKLCSLRLIAEETIHCKDRVWRYWCPHEGVNVLEGRRCFTHGQVCEAQTGTGIFTATCEESGVWSMSVRDVTPEPKWGCWCQASEQTQNPTLVWFGGLFIVLWLLWMRR